MKATETRLNELNTTLDEIDAIIVSHEHTDHMRGLDMLSGKRGIPILANLDTAKAIQATATKKLTFKIFTTGESFQFKDILVHPFTIQHDTLDPVAYTFEFNNLKIGFCTDLGFVTTLVSSHLRECDYLVIESNHEPNMVHACPRPPVYKQRVLGRQGHLSNKACSELLQEIEHDNLKHIYLAHLSEECNNPELALKMAREHITRDIPITIAYQHKVSVPILDSAGKLTNA